MHMGRQAPHWVVALRLASPYLLVVSLLSFICFLLINGYILTITWQHIDIYLYHLANTHILNMFLCHSVHGGWSHWKEVLACNKPCGGGGFRVLRRKCNNPEPTNGGNDCMGERFKIDHACADCPCEYQCCYQFVQGPLHSFFNILFKLVIKICLINLSVRVICNRNSDFFHTIIYLII